MLLLMLKGDPLCTRRTTLHLAAEAAVGPGEGGRPSARDCPAVSLPAATCAISFWYEFVLHVHRFPAHAATFDAPLYGLRRFLTSLP